MPASAPSRSAIWTISFSIGGILGPLIGGVLLEHFWWGSVFLIGVPAMALLLILGPLLLPEFRSGETGRYDLASAVMSLLTVLAVIYGVKHIAEQGLDWLAVLSIAAGLGHRRGLRAAAAAARRIR